MTDLLIHVWAVMTPVLAQAGGGGRFGGSGGGGGGFSGGGGGFSGGGGGGIPIPIGGGGSPVIFFIVVGFFILVRVAESQQKQRVVRTIRQGAKAQEESLKQRSLAAIAQRDPAFDLQTFLTRAANAFTTTQYAWSDQDLRSCRAFISDGVHERFELYIRMQQAEDIRNRMRNVQVVGWDVVAVETEQHFDTIHVRFRASAISYDESLTSGRRVGGNSDQTPIVFTEIWSFSRRPGVQTRTDASLLQGTCPNCGTQIGIVDRAECPSCASHVNSGAYDWVLTEITQDEEWIVPSSRAIPGLAAMQEADPGLNVQHLEDRASVIFWRAMMAVYFEDLDEAAPILPPGATSLPQLWNPGQGCFWLTPAVGSVEVLGARLARTETEADTVKVQVRWSASRASGNRRSPQRLDPQRIFTHVLVLARRPGTTSRTEDTFTSFSCRQCGAPLDVGRATNCAFCGTAINDGRTSWILTDVQPYEAMRGYLMELAREEQAGDADPVTANRMATDRLLNEPELLVALTRLATADGVLHDKERAHLTSMAASRGVPPERIQQILSSGQELSQPIQLPEEPEEARAFMVHLIRGALIDGEISKEERHLLQGVGGQIGWVDADLKRAIKAERARLYQQARDILRHAPAPGLDLPPPPPSPDHN